MVSVRAAKSKGSQFEYDCQYNLGKICGWEDIYRTSERGFQLQYDLHIDDKYTNEKIAIECKRLKAISWNQAVKFYEKLITKTKDYDKRYLLFKPNRQPCLVLHLDDNCNYIIQTFESLFKVSFDKHPSTRNR